LMAIGADGPIRASVILVSPSGASARGWFESISLWDFPCCAFRSGLLLSNEAVPLPFTSP
jgi:hypothetical protein